ncbi:MAG: 2-keto-4-pentenoate hydratase [Pseudomonadota bacterium]
MSIVDQNAAPAATLSQALDAVSQRLVTARLDATPLDAFPGDVPITLDDAYAVQSASIARWPDAVAGWKVGMVPAEFRDQLGEDRLCGPIYQRSVFDIGAGDARSMEIYEGGFAAVEAEFVFRLSETVEPIATARTDQELLALVSGLHVGVEIASSPMADVNRLGPCCVVSDFGNNAGLLVGPEVPGWHSVAPEALSVSVSVDGEVVGSASAAAIEGGLLQALRFLIDRSARRGLTLPAGTCVSCGAVTGIHDVTTASSSIVDFGEYGVFDVGFEARQPMQENVTSIRG